MLAAASGRSFSGTFFGKITTVPTSGIVITHTITDGADTGVHL
jgi:hypothetical protein